MTPTIRREPILGIPVADVTLDGAVGIVRDAVRDRQGLLSVVCANAHTLAETVYDDDTRSAFRGAGLVLPDGIGAAAASWIAGGALRHKVGGPDLVTELARRAPRGTRFYFFGTTPETLEKIVAHMSRAYPQIEIAGTWSPPMGPISEHENARAVEAINASRTDVLCVGMSAPKQEKWIAAHAAKLNVPVALAVGAAFDFLAGNKKRPAWAVRGGVFWLYRLVTEPRRLGARYLVGLPRFGWLALRYGLRGRTSKR